MPNSLKYIVGNWKMNGSKAALAELLPPLADCVHNSGSDRIKMVLCPPALYVADAAKLLGQKSPIALGGQDCHAESSGAFTGDVSPVMLADMGCSYVILGHSERRQYHGETESVIRKKIIAAQKAGLIPIFCIGETLAQRESGHTLDVLSRQLNDCAAEKGIDPEKLIVAYEPVWAIGTGRNATATDITSAHGHIRSQLQSIFGPQGAQTPILYGGSVKADNAKDIMAQRGVDGVLVGGASLKAQEFAAIYLAAGA